MDDEDAGEKRSPFADLEPRQPTEDDLVLVCRRLNEIGARYLWWADSRSFKLATAGRPATST